MKNTKFTSIIFEKILKFLEENKESLRKINNTIILGIIGVMVRIMKNHSCKLKESMVYLYLKLLALLHPYIIEKSYPEEEINVDDFKKYLEGHVDFIVSFYFNDRLDFIKYNSELWKIGKQFRELYFLFNPLKIVVKPRILEQVPALVRVPATPSIQLDENEEKKD